VEEYSIDLIGITVAQRYSVLVTARNDTSANWAIHANLDTVMFDHVPANLNPSPSFSLTTQILTLTRPALYNRYHFDNHLQHYRTTNHPEHCRCLPRRQRHCACPHPGYPATATRVANDRA
jgi:hypothetical protein